MSISQKPHQYGQKRDVAPSYQTGSLAQRMQPLLPAWLRSLPPERSAGKAIAGLASRWVIGLALCAGVCSSTGCESVVLGEDPQSCDLAEPTSERHIIHLITFWTKEPEVSALNVLREEVKAADGVLTETPRDNRTDLQTGLFVPGDPIPDVYQVNGGSDVLQFALGAPGDSTKICPLDRLFEQYSLEEDYFESAWGPSVCRGSHYAIPLTIHRLNTLMVNVELYAEAQRLARDEGENLPDIKKMRSAEELVSALEWIANSELAKGKDAVTPFSIGIGDDDGGLTNAWPLTILAYEALLASYSQHAYETIWQGGDFDEVEEQVRLLGDHLQRLGQVSNIQEALDWQVATKRVIEGRAVLTISGDWIYATVAEDDEEAVEMLTFPNAYDTFVYTPDSFAVPRLRGKDGSPAHGWFRDVTNNIDTQIEFARVKKAIPARKDLGSSELSKLESPYLEKTYEEFAKCQPDERRKDDEPCRLLLAVSGLAPGEGFDPCFDRTAKVLAVLAGVEYSEADWLGSDDTPSEEPKCDRPYPTSVKEARTELLTILRQVSEDPFAANCRSLIEKPYNGAAR